MVLPFVACPFVVAEGMIACDLVIQNSTHEISGETRLYEKRDLNLE